MIHHQVEQGSDPWLRARMGKPTASEFERIITPKKWEPTKGETRRAYQVYLLAELMLDMPLAGVTTAAMDAGKLWEPKARAAYEMLMGVDVELCGFCTNDAGTIGASPDGFVGDGGSVEIKCPFKPEVHVGYLLDPDSLKDEYFVQTQGQLYVTGRKWTDLISYFQRLPMVRMRVQPVAEFQEKLGAALDQFVAEFQALRERAEASGWIGAKAERPAPDQSPDFLSEADVEEHLADLKRTGVLQE